MSQEWNSEGAIWMAKLVNPWRKRRRQMWDVECQSRFDWHKVVGEKLEVGSTDEVKHIERNGQ